MPLVTTTTTATTTSTAAFTTTLTTTSRFKEAIEVYIDANEWDKARELSRTKATDYQGMVDQKYDAYLVAQKDGSELVNTGNWKAGVDMCVNRKKSEWGE